MIYSTCRYAPVELMAGFDETCVRLDPNPQNFACSEECAHPNLCSFAKAVIEEVHNRRIKQLIMTDCCDAMRRTYDVLSESGQMDFLFLLGLPHKNGEAEIRIFREELFRLKKEYEAFSGKTFDVRKALQAYTMQQEAHQERPFSGYVRISGAHGGRLLLEKMKETFPNVPVVDDTCTGTRYLSREKGCAEDFFDWYAQALFNQEQPCMRMWYHSMRTPAESGSCLGTVFHTIKFCDYYSFAYLEEKNSGHMLKIETDTTLMESGQLRTRLEAFREELGMDRKEIIMKKTEGPVYTAGIDSGSASTDAVVMDENRIILGKAVVPTGAGAASGAEKALAIALKQAGLRQEDLSALVSTGYGRDTIGVDSSVTEITCHARGAHFLDPDARTVIDIGGQDSKVIRIDEKGNVVNFIMNDKCAAGTGRFLEMQARTLGLTMPQMSEEGLRWTKDLSITNMCTVFAESEVVSLVAKNEKPADIIHGLNKAIAAKTAALAARLKVEPGVIMTGGVAQNAGVVKCLEERLNTPVFISENAQVCGSIGAALIALDSIQKKHAVD